MIAKLKPYKTTKGSVRFPDGFKDGVAPSINANFLNGNSNTDPDFANTSNGIEAPIQDITLKVNEIIVELTDGLAAETEARTIAINAEALTRANADTAIRAELISGTLVANRANEATNANSATNDSLGRNIATELNRKSFVNTATVPTALNLPVGSNVMAVRQTLITNPSFPDWLKLNSVVYLNYDVQFSEHVYGFSDTPRGVSYDLQGIWRTRGMMPPSKNNDETMWIQTIIAERVS